MNRPVSTSLKVTLSAAFGLLSLPTIGFGTKFLWCWIRVHMSNVYYLRAGYGKLGILFFTFGVISLWATLHAVWRRKPWLILVSALIAFVAARTISEMIPLYGDPNDGTCLGGAYSLHGWYERHQRFPANEAEFREAVEMSLVSLYGTGWPASHYAQNGNPLSYEIVVDADAKGPRITGVSKRPGVIYYCVSRHLNEYWVTMTALDSFVGTAASLKQTVGPPQEIWIPHGRSQDYAIKN
jgi:hypothetical protein